MSAFIPHVIFHLIARLIVGITCCGINISSFSLGVEWSVPKYRMWPPALLSFASAIGMMLFAGIASLASDWLQFSLAISVPQIVCLPIYFYIPESPRWLMTNKRFSKIDEYRKRSKEDSESLDLLDRTGACCSCSVKSAEPVFPPPPAAWSRSSRHPSAAATSASQDPDQPSATETRGDISLVSVAASTRATSIHEEIFAYTMGFLQPLVDSMSTINARLDALEKRPAATAAPPFPSTSNILQPAEAEAPQYNLASASAVAHNSHQTPLPAWSRSSRHPSAAATSASQDPDQPSATETRGDISLVSVAASTRATSIHEEIFADTMGFLQPLVDSMSTINARLDALEKQPAATAAPPFPSTSNILQPAEAEAPQYNLASASAVAHNSHQTPLRNTPTKMSNH
ncbi:UNVERIFIED_CONTAM: hypothetical protein FKN15_024251 [Acipenser sinensis]